MDTGNPMSSTAWSGATGDGGQGSSVIQSLLCCSRSCFNHKAAGILDRDPHVTYIGRLTASFIISVNMKGLVCGL